MAATKGIGADLAEDNVLRLKSAIIVAMWTLMPLALTACVVRVR